MSGLLCPLVLWWHSDPVLFFLLLRTSKGCGQLYEENSASGSFSTYGLCCHKEFKKKKKKKKTSSRVTLISEHQCQLCSDRILNFRMDTWRRRVWPLPSIVWFFKLRKRKFSLQTLPTSYQGKFMTLTVTNMLLILVSDREGQLVSASINLAHQDTLPAPPPLSSFPFSLPGLCCMSLQRL